MSRIAPYAVIFKAFKIDHFASRQLQRLQAAVQSGDIYVMIDETAGDAGPIDFERVIRYGADDLFALGFAANAQGSLFWYNGDYPLYYFQSLHPEYDVIVMMEYDAVSQTSLDGLVEAFRAERLDFVAEPILKPLEQYWWTKSMLHFYKIDQIRPYLICVAVFSSAAVRHLASCRLRQGQDQRVIGAMLWPVGEAFVGSELCLSGFRARNLSEFGSLSRFDWWPPTHELELPDLTSEAFVHPVLVGGSYVRSVVKNGYVTGLVNMLRQNWVRLICVIFLRSIWRRLGQAV